MYNQIAVYENRLFTLNEVIATYDQSDSRIAILRQMQDETLQIIKGYCDRVPDGKHRNNLDFKTFQNIVG